MALRMEPARCRPFHLFATISLLLLGLLLCSVEAKNAVKRKGASSHRFAAHDAPDKAVPFECVAIKPQGAASAKDLAPGQRAAYVASAIQSLERLPGVMVTGAYRGGISLMMTPHQAETSRSSLDTYCSRIFRSHPRLPTPVGAPAQNKIGSKPSRQAPAFDQKEAVKAMLLDQVEAYNNSALTGRGVKIGILSDSFNTLNDTFFPCDAVRDITVVKEFIETGIDEGRAMAELICFVAPDAQLFFHTAVEGLFAFAEAVEALRFIHECDVIVDDIRYFIESWYSPDVLLQAVQHVTTNGAFYFTSAGNSAGNAYEGSFNPLDLTGTELALEDEGLQTWHNFGTTENPIVFLRIATSPTFLLGLQWDEAWSSFTDGDKGAESDLDLWVCFDEIPTTAEDLAANCTASDFLNIDLGLQDLDPIEAVSVEDANVPVFVGVRLYATTRNAPSDIKMKLYWPRNLQAVDGQGVVFDAATTSQHGNTELAMSIGAANRPFTPGFGVRPARLATYSSWGNQALYLDADGNRLETPKVLDKPDIVAVDGTLTSFFGDENRFFGTSAAAPHAAAIAALMIQQKPNITPAELTTQMREKADDMYLSTDKRPSRIAEPTRGVDRFSGHGFLLANELLSGLASVCDSGVCCNTTSGFFLPAGSVCRHASRCQLESRCRGDRPECPASNKPDGQHCPWSPPNTLPKRGYHPYSNAAPLATNPTYEHKWHECDGVCFDGVCALAWESPECCHVAGRHGYYRREEEEHYGRRYDAADAQEADDTAGTEHWEAGDLYCRR